MLDTTKTEPFTATVRQLINEEGAFRASLAGFSSWYAVPAHLTDIVRDAYEQKQPIKITTGRREILSAEVIPEQRSAFAVTMDGLVRGASAFIAKLHHPHAPNSAPHRTPGGKHLQ